MRKKSKNVFLLYLWREKYETVEGSQLRPQTNSRQFSVSINMEKEGVATMMMTAGYSFVTEKVPPKHLPANTLYRVSFWWSTH